MTDHSLCHHDLQPENHAGANFVLSTHQYEQDHFLDVDHREAFNCVVPTLTNGRGTCRRRSPPPLPSFTGYTTVTTCTRDEGKFDTSKTRISSQPP